MTSNIGLVKADKMKSFVDRSNDTLYNIFPLPGGSHQH